MSTDCTSTGYREPTPFYVCFIPLPPPYSSSIKRASTHATVAPPPISDHPLAFRDCFNHPRGPCGQRARVAWWSSHVGWIRSWSEAGHGRRGIETFAGWRDGSRTKILAVKFCLLYTMWIRCDDEIRWTLNFDTTKRRDEIVNLILERDNFILNSNIFKNSYFEVAILVIFVIFVREIWAFKREKFVSNRIIILEQNVEHWIILITGIFFLHSFNNVNACSMKRRSNFNLSI